LDKQKQLAVFLPQYLQYIFLGTLKAAVVPVAILLAAGGGQLDCWQQQEDLE
jgi:hypothetical protein